MYNTKLQGRSRIRRTHNYTWHRRQKQLNPIVTVGNKITKAVCSDKAKFMTGKTRPQPIPMSDIRGLRQQVWKEPGLLDVRYKTPASLITARQQFPRFLPCRSSLKDLSFFFFTYWRDKIWNWAPMGYSLATLSLNMSKLGIGNKVPRFRRHYDAIIREWK